MNDIIEQIGCPSTLVEEQHFLIKIAESAAEIKAAQHLRYKVF